MSALFRHLDYLRDQARSEREKGTYFELLMYVNASPLTALDSNGLVKWSGQSVGGALTLRKVFALSISIMRFESKCKNGDSCVVYTLIAVGGVGAGLPISLGLRK